MGNFLHVTIVCSDCIPGETRARAGMLWKVKSLGSFQCVGRSTCLLFAGGRCQRSHCGSGEDPLK